MRLGAVLSSLHVAVGPSEMYRIGAGVPFAKLGGATSFYLSLKSGQVRNCSPGYMEQALINDFRSQAATSSLVASFLASFGAIKERKGASNAWWGSTKDQAASPLVLQAHLFLLFLLLFLQGLMHFALSLGRCSDGEELAVVNTEHSSFIQLSLGGG